MLIVFDSNRSTIQNPLMRQLSKFNLILYVIICMASCEPDEIVDRSAPPGEIKVSAEVKNSVYTNDRNIKLDASNTGQINGKRNLTYTWTCKAFPVGQAPQIKSPSSAVATIDSLMIGKYNFQLTVKDDFGHLVNADYITEVFRDTLTGAPKIVPTADQTVVYPATYIVLGAALSVYANPVNRKLEFEWSILQKPVANRDPIISDKSSVSTYIRDLEAGNYQVMLKITNEKGLSAYDTIGITVPPTPILVTKEYEDTWFLVYDDWGDYLQLYVFDPDNFVGRNRQNTTITVLNMETQQLLDDSKYYWDINDNELYVYYYDFSLNGKKAKVTVRYQP